MTPETVLPMDRPDPEAVRCPTCRAAQPWSDACRRCGSDLRLLREFAEAYRRRRLACLRSLRSGDLRAAWRAARDGHALSASAESRRLKAVAALLLGDPATAVALARRSPRDD